MRDLPDKLDRLDQFVERGLITRRYALERASALAEEFERRESQDDLAAHVLEARREAQRAYRIALSAAATIIGDVAEQAAQFYRADLPADQREVLCKLASDMAYSMMGKLRDLKIGPTESDDHE